MGMGNNPVSLVDPDGGFASSDPTLLDEILLTASGGGGFDFSSFASTLLSFGGHVYGGFGTPDFNMNLYPNSTLLPTVDLYAYQNYVSLNTDGFSYYGGSPMVPGKGSILKAIKNIPSLVKSLKNLPSLVKSTKDGVQGIKSLGAAGRGFSKTINFGKIKVPAETFHRTIKPNILGRAGNFSKVVGRNPDIKIVGDKIRLTGTGPFKGKSFNTGLDASDFFGGF